MGARRIVEEWQVETLSAALRNPVRWTLDGALFAALLIVAVTGVAVERSIAYTVGAVTTPNTANSMVYGNWIETPFAVSATVSGSASTGVTWSASNLPPNTAAEFRFVDDNTSSTPTPTLFIEQVDGTPGPDAASYTITVTATGSDASVETGTLTLVVEPRPVRIEGSFSVQNKTYDASTDANITSTSLSLTASDGLDSGILTGDDLELVEVATFSSADVGLRTATLGSSSLGGADAVNYELDLANDPDDGYTVPTASATVSAKSLELDPSSLTFSKTYDGLTTITPSGTPAVESEGLEGSDSAPTVSGSPTWGLDNANVGTSKTITITSSAYSLSDGNYTLSSPTFTTATVTKATLTVNFSTSSRAYNGSKDVTDDTTITGYSGRATADSDVTASFTAATLASASVGTHAVTLSGLSLSSAQAEANYTVVAQTGRTGQITKKTLTIGGTLSTTAGEYDKVYDGTRVASGDTSVLSLVGVEGADSVSIASVTLQFAQADTGTAIVVSVSAASLGGDDQGNYQISASGAPSATGDITAFEFTINDTLTATATAKTYDGNADANVTCTLSTFADGLGVAADCSNATFDNGGAVVLDGSTPQAHAISITSITLANNSAGNYALPGDSMTTTGVINPKQLTISGLSGVDRTYNGGVDASVTGTETLVGVVGADDVTLTTSGRSFEFANKNVGSDKAITASGYEISGQATSNYTLTQPTGLTADITAKSVTVSATHDGRVYNSTTHVDSDNLTLTVNGFESDDAVTVSYEEALFNSEDASQNDSDFRTVSATGISLGGADASNYSLGLTTASDTEVLIDKRPLSIGAPSFTYSGSATGTAAFYLESREWDSTNETELVFVCNDDRTNCLSDDVDVKVSGSFAEIYVHTGPFTFDNAISVTGSHATNYSYTLPSSSVEGSINRMTIRVGGLTVSSGKTYDGNDSASSVISGTPTISSTLAQNDGVTLITTGNEVYTFETQYVGSDLDITTTGFALSGADLNDDGTNEFVIDQPSFLADITVREVTITGTFTANDRVYNTNTTATIDNNSLTLDGIQSGDTVTLNTPTIAFASANANESTPTTVTITAATLSATDMNDDGEAEYSLSLVDAPETTATISRFDLDSTLRATVANKTYDSTTTATVTSVSVTDLAGDDVTVASGYTGVFVTEAVGTDIDVNLSGLTLQGRAKDNYTLSSKATIENAADITAAALQVGGIPTPSNKTYDGTNDTFFGTSDSLVDDSAATLTGVADDDTVTLDNSGADFVFTNVNQGLRTIQGSGYALSGTHAANYTLTQPTLSATLSATIERKVLTVSANTDAASNTRVYNTTDNARSITTLVLSGIVSGDESDVEATATSITFDDPDGDERAKDVGANKLITASGVELATPTGGSSTVTGNYSLRGVTSVQTSASITKRPLTLTPSPLNTVSDNSSRYEKIYDGQAAAEYDDGSGTVEMVTCSVNSLSGDTVSADCTDASFADKNVARDGSDEVITVQNISLSGTDASNYSLASTTLTLTEAAINPKPLVASGFEPNDKVYDGKRSATFSINSASLSGFVGSDNFAFDSLTGVFFSRDVAVSGGSVVDQNVRLTSWRFNGTDGVTDNYTIDIDNSITQGKITPKDLPVVLTATSRPYNANTTVTLSAEVDTDSLEDRDLPQGGDAFVDATATGAFPEKNVGTHTITSLSVSLTGGDAGDRSDNYVPVFSAPSATITARTLTWTVNASDKTYDGTDDAGLSLSDISDNRLSGDVLTVTFSSDTFDSANAGVGKTVTVSGLSISGTDAGNYSYATSATDTATISQRQVSVAGTFTSDAKEYDRNTAATLTDTSSLSLSNLVAADQPGISIASTTAQFDTNAVGQNKTVQLTGLTLSGTNSSNYSVDVSGVTDYTEGEITPKSLTPTITAQDRLWDGTTNATITATLAGVISGDSVSVDTASAVGAFRDADQGSSKTVDVTNIRFNQTGAWANYVLDLTETAPGVYSGATTASITGSPLTISIVASDKTYDGTTAATDTVTFTAADNSTVVPTYSGGTATFSQSDVGTNLLVTASGFTLTGADADEYVLSNTSATDRADITAITLGITAEDKVYDGTDRATVDLDGVLSGDDVGFASAPTATFDDPVGDARGKDVGVSKAVTATGISLTGDDSGNYSIGGTETATASISQRLLTPVFTPNPAVTQATSPVTVDVTDDRITNDVLTVSYTLAETIRRGNQLVLVVTNITLSDTDGDNYRVVSPYELVLETFATPTRERDGDIAPPVEATPAPQVAPRVAPRPAVPPATGVERPVAPSPAPTAPVAEQPGAPSPDILPGWRPPVSSRATIDFGQGILERTSRPRDLADQIKVEPPSILVTDRFDGFEPQAPAQLEIMGAKTVTSIRVTAEDAGNPERLRALLAEALQQSPNQPGLPATTGPQIVSVSPDTASRVPSPATREVLEDALAWLGLPPLATGPGVSEGTPVAELLWEVEGFRPGSSVFLVVTSDPGLVAWGTANDDGVAVLQGTLQEDSLIDGEHRLRIIGTSVFEGGLADDTGAVVFTEELTALTTGFDRDTRISVALWGANPEGADHVAVRYIDPELAGDNPLWWWLLLIPILWVLIVLWRRRQGDWTSPTGRVGTASTGAISPPRPLLWALS